jgi:T5SS/PEP-CTERM-associated repeat protein/autotransporter-associated beta strand protein
MMVDGGYAVENNSNGVIGYTSAASSSSVKIHGAGSSWTNASFLEIGSFATGLLDIYGGGHVSSKGGYLGGVGGNGLVTVGGGSGISAWSTSSSALYVGYEGTGKVDITGGGVVHSNGAYIGFGGGSSGFVTVGGGVGPSSWQNTFALDIGVSGTGSLHITGGGSVSTNFASIGRNVYSSGTVTVGGGIGPSYWTSPNGYVVGYLGSAALNIVGGGTVSGRYGYVGYGRCPVCTAIVGGGVGASLWKNSSSLTVGQTGPGQLNIITGGTVISPKLDGGNPSGSSVNFDGGILSITGTDSATNRINLLAGGGTIDVPTAATTFTITSPVNGAGGLTKTGQATLALTGANTYTGGTTVTEGVLTLSGATAKLGTGNVSVHSSGAGSLLQIQNGVSNAIADTAILSLSDGPLAANHLSPGIAVALVPNRAYVDLGAGVNEVVNMLLLNGVVQGPGTYGSSTSSATIKNDVFFAGDGMITVPVPEPTSASLLLFGLAGLAARRRQHDLNGRQI